MDILTLCGKSSSVSLTLSVHCRFTALLKTVTFETLSSSTGAGGGVIQEVLFYLEYFPSCDRNSRLRFHL